MGYTSNGKLNIWNKKEKSTIMRVKEPSTNVYFIRHGQTDFPLDRIYCDNEEDPALNINGIYQAKSAAVWLQNKNISAIYASPARRTQMTAKEISDVTGIEIVTRNEWVERRFGIWEGLYFHEIEAQYPELYLKWKQDNVGFSPEGGENISDVLERLDTSLQQILADHKGETIAIVSHVGPIRVSLCQSLNIPIDNFRQIRIDYASISRVDYGATRNNLISINSYNYS